MFPHSPRPLLKWKKRSLAVVETLTSLIPQLNGGNERASVPDLLCLQEVDNYFEFYRGALRKIGYNGQSYKRRTSERSEKRDGSLIAFSTDRFELLEETHIEFNALRGSAPCLQELARLRNVEGVDGASTAENYLIRDKVAAVVVLRDTISDSVLLVASAHIFWDPSCTDIKILQAVALARHLDAIVQRRDDIDNVVLAGDFNSEPDSSILHMFTTGRIDCNHKTCWNIPKAIVEYVKDELARCTHVLPLVSVYEFNGMQPGSPEIGDISVVSTLTGKYKGVLDYILVRSLRDPSPDSCPARSSAPTFELLSYKEYLKAGVRGFPSKYCPSDHFPIAAFLDVDRAS